MRVISIAVVGLLAGHGVAEADAAKKGWNIAKKVERANEGFKSEKSTMEMILYNAHGDTTKRKMNSVVKETKSDGDKSRIEFEWPRDVKGTRMLTWTHKSKDDSQWLFLPTFKRIKRITASNKSGSFMGSEFSYEDLGSQEPEKYNWKFVADTKLSGRKVWNLERTPKDKSSGYSKQIMWIDQGYMNPVKIQYYDRRGTLLKTAIFSNYKKFGKYWRVGKIEMKNHQTRKRSTITWANRKLGVGVDDDAFDADELDS